MELSLLQKQALKTAFIGLLFLAISALVFYAFIDINVVSISLYAFLVFVCIYLIYLFQIKGFMHRQISRVYESNLFENEAFVKSDLDAIDLDALINKIKDFAESKHQEIDKLKDRDDFRRDFIGDISHELKTPLFTAQGYLLTVLDESIDDPDLQRKYLERTNKSIERLTYIVKDLDMIAKLESGMKLNYQKFNLIKVIQDVFEILEMKASKKNITLGLNESYDYPVLVRADKEKIEQVLINLLSNSIKYGTLNGSTLVSIDSYSPQQFIVNVADNGTGIPQEHIPRLFERFYRIDKSRSRDEGGSGLGLSIVKHIIEAHEQEVFVQSTPGKGSIFSFTINKVI